jgi:hypothetical protein
MSIETELAPMKIDRREAFVARRVSLSKAHHQLVHHSVEE